MSSADQQTEPVVVSISGCAKEDAHAVFEALRHSYDCDRGAGDRPDYVSAGHPTVWTATFDAATARDPAGPVPLTTAVDAEMQGGYWAVDRMTETLSAVFRVERQGSAAGDQEKDVQLRLLSRAG
ncbi:hypothetical protein [Streptomyces sp. NPDC058953]|uniref:hypothetical protein n=1 Tax=unclassified Streptomyces TaxID=2593676 RepID=UPI0036AB8FD8